MAIIGGGKIFNMGVRGTWLYSKTNNEECYCSVDNQSGKPNDISGLWHEELLFYKNFAKLYEKHQRWTQGKMISRVIYPERAELDEHRKAIRYHAEYMEKLGYIRFVDGDKQFWKYTLRGAIKISFYSITVGTFRHIMAFKRPR